VRDALRANLPKRPATLERWMEPALCGQLPRRLTARARRLAIDWHLIPYHGEPHSNPNELYHSLPKSGTTKFHAYATVCVVQNGFRFTLATTYVRGNESVVTVLQRLLDRVAALDVRIKELLLDRQFFTAEVMAFLQSRIIPYVIPIVLRGAKPKKASAKKGLKQRRRPQKLRDFRKRGAGRYGFTWKVKKVSLRFHVVVAYKSYTHHRTQRRRHKKLLYAVWRVSGSPVAIRELYRRRFGIESSYRQLRQARIRTCTADPVLRLFFVIVALVLRNVWVWLHLTYFAEGAITEPTLHLERLRFRRMLNWIAHVIATMLHDGSAYQVELE
jgi:DDE family transposase